MKFSRALRLFVLITLPLSLLALRLFVYPYDSTAIAHNGELFPILHPPSSAHILGTSSIGQDVFVRTVDGLLVALFVLTLGSAAALTIGALFALVSYLGGTFVDKLMSYIGDALYSIPSLLIALSMLLGLPADSEYRLQTILLAVSASVGLFFGAKIFRTLRVNLARERQEGYFVAAHAAGLSRSRLFVIHLLPNSLRGIRPLITGAGSDAVLTLAGLGFVGVGISATDGADWGYDLSRGVADLSQGIWWTTLFPALAISLVVLLFSRLSEGRGQIDNSWRR